MKKFLTCLTIGIMLFTCAFSLCACNLGNIGAASIGGGNNNPDTCQHSYGEYFSNMDATCEEDGTKSAYCVKCGSKNTVADIGSKLGHTFDNYFYDGNASCEQGGTKTAICTKCHTATDTIMDDSHPMRDHTYTEYKSDNNATCDTNGTKTAVCDTCKTATHTVEEAGTAGHNYVNGACSVCRASHLVYKLAGKEYTVTGIAEDCVSSEIIIPATENGLPVFSISENVFKDNYVIKKVTLSDNIRIIGNHSFDGCANLTSVIFGNGLTDIRYQAFANCISLESISFPNSLRTIGQEALADCTNLKEVNFGSQLASLLTNCFDGCFLLERVNFAEGNVSFRNISGVVYNGSRTLIIYVPHALSGKVAIPSGFSNISSASFQNRNKITGIYIPKSVHTINSFAFSGCSALNDVYYEGSEEDWDKVKKENNWQSGAPEFTVHFNAVVEE